MPKVYHRTARSDIYEKGQKKKAPNKQGYTIDRCKPCNRADKIIIKKGQKYFAWHPKGSDWQYSANKPDLRSAWQIESDDWEDRVTQIEDRISDVDEVHDGSDLDNDRTDLKEELESRIDELQYSLDNMPEQLQESSILNERIEELNGFNDRLDS